MGNRKEQITMHLKKIYFLFNNTLPEWNASENKHKHNSRTVCLMYNVIHTAVSLHNTCKYYPTRIYVYIKC